MSTRCTTHFVFDDTPQAIIYRHTDGYPEKAGVDLQAFLKECKKLPDSRLNDPSYLAARYVVYLARDALSPNFISVGVCLEDPSDIEYRYTVDCSSIGKDGLPDVKCTNAHNDEEPIPIPDDEAASPTHSRQAWI